MKRLSLIANTSIQYYRYDAEIDLDFGKNNRLYYRQPFDVNLAKITYENLIRINIEGQESYYRKAELNEKGFLANNKLKEGVDLASCTEITNEYFDVSNLKNALKKFEGKWIPLPFFKNNTMFSLSYILIISLYFS